MKQIEIHEPIQAMKPGSDPPTPLLRGGDNEDLRRDEPDDPWSVSRWFDTGIANTRPFNETHKGRKASRQLSDLFAECEVVRASGQSENPQIHIIDDRVFAGIDNDDYGLCKTAVEGMIPGIAYALLKQLMPFEDAFLDPIDKLPRAANSKAEKPGRNRNGVKKKRKSKPAVETEAEAEA